MSQLLERPLLKRLARPISFFRYAPSFSKADQNAICQPNVASARRMREPELARLTAPPLLAAPPRTSF
jgi:hypothetical protein